MRAALLVIMLVACGREEQKSTAAKPAAVQAPTAPTPAPKSQTPPPRPKELAHVTIKAIGMYCEETCPMKVRYALADMNAVYELGFDVSNEAIFVSYDASLGPAKQVTKPMIAAIKGAGFDPWLAKEEWPADAKTEVVLR